MIPHQPARRPRGVRSPAVVLGLLLVHAAAFADGSGSTNLPPPLSRPVSFDRDVRPILKMNGCLGCHGPKESKSDFRLDLRVAALQGGDDNTNDIVPGHSDQSQLIRYVAGLDKHIRMPPASHGPALPPAQVSVLRAWIDQGASWGTNIAAPTLAFSLAPALRWIGGHGDAKKFRELDGIPEGFGGGVEHFFSQQSSAGSQLTLQGHALFPEHDFKFALKLQKDDVGFVGTGVEEWRRYYDDTGGFDPGFTPSTFSLGRDLHLDLGRAWVNLGLTLPDAPEVVLGYEYQFRQGAKSTLAWGTAVQNGTAKNIYPNAEGVSEHTHIIKLDLTHVWHGWELEDRGRVEFYRLGESRDDAVAYTSGPQPDVIERVNQKVHYTHGANTFRLVRQVTDWWRLSAGTLYSRFDGTTLFSQSALDSAGAPTFGAFWRTEGVTLERDSRVGSLASLLQPIKGLSFSAAGQAEWTDEKGFGNVDLDFGGPGGPGPLFPGSVNANQHQTQYSESFDAQFTRVPRTVWFAEARLQQEKVGQSDASDNPLEPVAQRTDALNHLYDACAGFTTSPWSWLEFGSQYRRRDSSTGYNHSLNQPGNGYPGFITHRNIGLDEIEGRLVLHPTLWLSARLTYDWNRSRYTSTTAGATNFDGSLITSGGWLLTGRTVSHVAGLNVTVTPMQRLYCSGGFTYSFSRTTTAANGNAAIVPYRGDVFTVNASAGMRLNARTDLNAVYVFSRSTYGQSNPEGLPLGLDFTRHEVRVGVTRQLTKNWSSSLQYQFSRYTEPSSGGVNNFTAHGIFATLAYRWP